MSFEKFDSLLSEIETTAAMRGGWAAMWQSDMLQQRILDAVKQAAEIGFPRHAILFDTLYFAVRDWGDASIHTPDPRVATIIDTVNNLQSAEFTFNPSRYTLSDAA